MGEEVEGKVLGYQCPRCERAAFFLNGKKEDYRDGAHLSAHGVRASIFKTNIAGEIITCQFCLFPFTTGVLYTRNIGTFGEKSGRE